MTSSYSLRHCQSIGTLCGRVLEHLQEHELYLKLEKCKFEQRQIEYLRVIVSEGLMEMDPVKVSGIAEWSVP